MTAAFVRAIATDGEVRLTRERRQKVEEARVLALLHLLAISTDEALPLAVRCRCESALHEAGARRELRQPDVIPVVGGKAFSPYTARRAAHCTNAQSLSGHSVGPKTNDTNAHMPPAASRLLLS